MARKKWWQWILFFVRTAAQAAEDGEIGAGRKTQKVGETAGKILDGATEITEKESN